MSRLYTGQAIAINGRDGHVQTSNGLLNVNLSRPKSLNGEERSGTTNPEELFAMAYATCFGGAIKEIARLRAQTIKEPQVSAHVTLNKTDMDGFYLSVKLAVQIPDLSKADANQLVKAAQEICPYSKAVRNNIKVIFE